ncbi:MAG: uroporphyrinogen decarboxylase family protein [Candidatus Limnocylindrales bacterium]
MTPRQRFKAVLRGDLPDRVPVTLFIQDQGHFINQMYPQLDPWDATTIQLKVIELSRQFGADVFVRLLFGTLDPFQWMFFGGLNVSEQSDSWEVRTEETNDGRTTLRRSQIRTPGGTLRQEFSIDEIRPGTLMYACTEKPVRTMADLELVRRYEPGMPAWWPAAVHDRIAPIRAAVGDDGIVGCWSPHGPFNMASLLIDEQDLYAMFYTDPDFYRELMEVSLARVADYTRAIDAAGIDVHLIGGNVPGGFLGRRNYEQHVLAYERRQVQLAQANGTPAIYHNCGQIMQLVESYKGLGVVGVEPFSPPPQLGDADLALVKELVGSAYVVVGGVDQVLVIQSGSVDDVRRATERTMEMGKPGGRFILQNADFLEYGTPPENVEAFVQTAIEHAGY